MKLLSQLEHVDIATPLARSDEGNISGKVDVSTYHPFRLILRNKRRAGDPRGKQ